MTIKHGQYLTCKTTQGDFTIGTMEMVTQRTRTIVIATGVTGTIRILMETRPLEFLNRKDNGEVIGITIIGTQAILDRVDIMRGTIIARILMKLEVSIIDIIILGGIKLTKIRCKIIMERIRMLKETVVLLNRGMRRFIRKKIKGERKLR